MKTNIVVFVGLTMLLAATFGLAQGDPNKVRANIPHEFTAAGKVLPAGQYDFSYNALQRTVTIKDTDKGPAVIMPIVTLLAGAMHTTPPDSHIVFDKVGSYHYLSEIWIPGLDGILLVTTKDKHEHEMLNVPR